MSSLSTSHSRCNINDITGHKITIFVSLEHKNIKKLSVGKILAYDIMPSNITFSEEEIMKSSRIVCAFVMLLLLGFNGRIAHADQLNLAIMEDMSGAAKKYAPLIGYLKNKGIEVTLIEVPAYTVAAQTFALGKVDAMFSGSGIAGTMMIKGVANPLDQSFNFAFK